MSAGSSILSILGSKKMRMAFIKAALKSVITHGIFQGMS